MPPAAKNLPQYINSLTEPTLKNTFGLKTYQRGKEYFDNGQVLEVAYCNNKTTLQAVVEGNRKYRVLIEWHDHKPEISCSCPVGVNCKHAVAVLLDAMQNEPGDADVARAKLHAGARVVLDTMTKTELIRYIIEKMPEKELRVLGNSVTDKNAALLLLQKAIARNTALFDNEDKLYDIEAFAQQLEKILQPLEGLEKIIPQELVSFTQEVMQLTNNAQDEGLLYDDYNDTGVKIPELFFTLTRHALEALPARERAAAKETLLINLSEATYTTFALLKSELQKMTHAPDKQTDPKTRLLSRLAILPAPYIRDEYRVLEKTFSDTEKEQVLQYLCGYSDMLIQLAELYCRTGRNNKALQLLRTPVYDNEVTWLPENIIMLFLRLEKEAGSNMESVGTHLLKWMPTTNTLAALIKITGQHLPAWERILEQHSPDHYFRWLEINNRLNEALEYVKTKKGYYLDKDRFIIRHKKQFREEAEALLCSLIDSSLQRTGNSAYEDIGNYINHIREINPEMADGLVTDIRTRFPKRRKLMEVLAGK